MNCKALTLIKTPIWLPGLARRVIAMMLSAVCATAAQVAEPVYDLQPLVVTGVVTPRAADAMVQPVSVYQAAAHVADRAPQLALMLDGALGVHVTQYGAGAARPVIRGLGGPRVRVLEAGLDSGDVADTSPDHAVAFEPFFIDRMETVRGPATLVYGSGAIGGVVNVEDRRLARGRPQTALSGELMAGYAGAARGWETGILTTLGLGNWAFTLGGLHRDHGDYRIPGDPESAALRAAQHHDEEDAEEHADEHHDDDEHAAMDGSRLPASFVRSTSGSLGVAWFPSRSSRLGLTVLALDSRYGVPGHAHGADEHHEEDEHHDADEHHDEDEVSIGLAQRRLTLEFVHELAGGWLHTVQARSTWADYSHTEYEGDAVGTRFDRRSWEARLEGGYTLGDPLPGIIGLQVSDTRLAAVGDEAPMPRADTRDAALFVLQEWLRATTRFEAGARLEQRRIAANADRYRDTATSLSTGVHQPLGAGHSLSLAATRSQRHPTALELYSDGPHAATRRFEIGDAGLGVETATNIDGTVRLALGPVGVQVTLFATRFSDFIHLQATDAQDDGLPVFEYTAADAQFHGVELEMVWHALHAAEQTLHVIAMADSVRGSLRAGGNLPHLPPLRYGLRVEYGRGPWLLRTSVQHTTAQTRTAEFELPTASFTEWNADLALRLPWGGMDARVTLGFRNLLDAEIRRHVSPLKDVAPAAGRSGQLAVDVSF
jgi:iron complex outermembrane recepter protein